MLKLESWLASKDGNHNEIGDSNTIVQYDPHWCGHLFGTNALKKNGFMEAYTHYGRGLVIYDGFDSGSGLAGPFIANSSPGSWPSHLTQITSLAVPTSATS